MSLSLGNPNKSSWLSIVLEDYKSAEAVALSRESYKSMVREEASQQGFDIDKFEV